MSIEKTPNYNLNKPGYDNFGDVADLNENADIIDAALQNKVDKEAGKGLSEANFTSSEKTKLAGIQAGAQPNAVTSVAGKTGAVTLDKTNVGLGNVDNAKQMPIAGGTFTGVVVSQANTSYTTRQLRNVVMSTGNPSGGSNGDIWVKYV